MKTWFKRIALTLLALLLVGSAVIAIDVYGGHPMGLFSGSRPAGLGFRDGHFLPPSWKPNCVSSTVEPGDGHFIAPLAFSGDAGVAWDALVRLVKAQKNATVVEQGPTYLYAEFKTAGMGFVDDVEFALDSGKGLIQVRSASRLGIRDFDVNRKRIEGLRAAFKP
jgi:uncharacterized protein (DUF1499 family)